MFSLTASAILRGPWLLEKAFVHAHLPFVAKMIMTGELPSFSTERKRVIKATVKATEGDSPMIPCEDFTSHETAGIAVICISGAIMKNTGDCGEPGALDYAEMISEADANSNFIGSILLIDSPGGTVAGTQLLADRVKACKKPVVAFIREGMAASAAYWIASAADEIYLSRKTDRVGSIGVMTTLADEYAYFESLGLKIRDIYAKQSTEKNQDLNEALKGNDEMLIEELSFIADVFIPAVKENRKGKINLSAGDPFKGAMYYAPQALEIGLIDGVKNFSEVISRVSELSLIKNKAAQNSTAANNQANSKGENMDIFGNKLKAVASLAGIEASEITSENLAAANSALIENNIEGVELIKKGSLTEASATINSLQEQIATFKTEATTAADAVKAAQDAQKVAEEKAAKLESDITALKASRGNMRSISKKEGTDVINTDDQSAKYRTSVDDEAQQIS